MIALLRSPRWRITFMLVILLTVVALNWRLLTQTILLEADFMQYWTAAYLTVRSVSPYDYEATLAVYRSVMDLIPNQPFLYPPWLIPFYFPFSLLPLPPARALWYFLSLGLVVLGATRLWAFYGGPKAMRWLGLLFAITFSPTLLALTWGQLSPLTLAAVALFLGVMYPGGGKPPRYFLAGILLALTSLKPQSFYLLWAALLLWSVQRREWRVLLGALAVLGASTLVAALFVPGILWGYLTSFLNNPPILYGTPTIGYWLREWLGREHFALQYAGPLVGVAWLLWDWRRKRGQWDWAEQMPWLMFASIITSPFIWTHDQVIFLLPLLQVTAGLANANPRLLLRGVFPAWLAANAVLVALHAWQADAWFTWQAPLCLLLYAWAVRLVGKPARSRLTPEMGKVEPV